MPYLIFLFAIIVPLPNIDYVRIDVQTARKMVRIAREKKEIPKPGWSGYNEYREVLTYCYTSIYANSARGNGSVTIIHPKLPKLSDMYLKFLRDELEKEGFEVQFNPINVYEIKIFWTNPDEVLDDVETRQ